ncbi:alpha-glucan water dikinase, chloroplastic [Sesbania bispinosa]|nr:alpha-glucan water dikinase, chloroplastic [Sesbania bispinosa]
MAFELMDKLEEEKDERATTGAKAISDFNVLQLINKPTIVAIAYLDKKASRKNSSKVEFHGMDKRKREQNEMRMVKAIFPVSSKSSKCSFQGARSASSEGQILETEICLFNNFASKIRHAATVSRAVLTMIPASEPSGNLNLDGDIELQVGVSSSAPGVATEVDILPLEHE